MERVYPHLRRLAASRLRSEHCSLQATELVNEACVRLLAQYRVNWQSRDQLFALAAIMMRRVLVERARKVKGRRVTLRADHLVEQAASVDVLDLNDALESLQTLYPRKAMVVELRSYGGMTTKQVTETMAISRSTVERDYRFGCAWLRRELGLRHEASS